MFSAKRHKLMSYKDYSSRRISIEKEWKKLVDKNSRDEFIKSMPMLFKDENCTLSLRAHHSMCMTMDKIASDIYGINISEQIPEMKDDERNGFEHRNRM